MPTKKLIAPFYERLALILIGFCVLGYLVIMAKELIDPMIFGFLFAVLLLPVSNFFEKNAVCHAARRPFYPYCFGGLCWQHPVPDRCTGYKHS
jgi:predicted PurR-regulated permease PerM